MKKELSVVMLLCAGCAQTSRSQLPPIADIPRGASVVEQPVMDFPSEQIPSVNSERQQGASEIELTSSAEVTTADGQDGGEEKIATTVRKIATVGFMGREIPDGPPLEEPREVQGEVPPEPMPMGRPRLTLDEVIASVYASYPLLESALFSRNIAAGQQLSAQGGFDLKLKAASENTPVGFYETFRNSVGFVQPLLSGADIYGGYRVGRGSFEPWYKERQTNDGGELKAGIVFPLAQDRTIDARRAELWRTGVGRVLVEPEIQAQLIDFVQKGSYAYWDWVAAGENYRIAERVLKLAQNRTQRIRRQVEEDLIDPPELTDNLRLIAEREAKLADAERKLQQTAVKLSLYFRDPTGAPFIPSPDMLPEFPEPTMMDRAMLENDIHVALTQRPEIAVLDFTKKQLDIDWAEAKNQLQPSVDAEFTGSQDMGYPTSSKNDKGDFQLDASVFVDVPLQRRKARGKMMAIEGKVAQLNAKRRMTEDKIVADVRVAYAALVSAYEQVQRTREAVELAEELAQRERRNQEEGLSDLLKVTLREQYAAESAMKAVDALLLYFQSWADYRAALAQDSLAGH
ncbi:MAG: TolC family protein [Planctomycetaceae bacterium]|nr:TolC family protein [Planctomycetaceae bacterium]